MQLSYQAYIALHEAKDIGIKYEQEYIGAEDLLLAMLNSSKNEAYILLKPLGKIKEIRKKAGKRKVTITTPATVDPIIPKVGSRFKGIIGLAIAEAKHFERSEIGIADFIMAILKNADGIAADALISSGVTKEKFALMLQRIPNQSVPLHMAQQIFGF